MAFGQSPPFSCGTNGDSTDYQAALDFLNNGNHVAGSWNSEVPVPIHIIYVNQSNGTPPGQTIRISESVNVANQVFDGVANIVICGYHHINNSTFANFNWVTDRIPLYDLYHSEEAINVYIVSMLDVGSGVAPFPWADKNNMIVINKGADKFTLAHELGHSFGLYHTHQGNAPISGSICNLLDPNSNPLTTGDLVEDTPVDPGDLCAEPVSCPSATIPCTPNCTTNGGQTYTYTGYWANNIMSYHRHCQPQVLTDDQKDRVKDHLANHAGLAFLRNGIEPTCNNDISEIGYIHKYCQFSTPNPSVVSVKDIFVDLINEETGWEGDRKRTISSGEYDFYSNDYSNPSYVTIEPIPSHPLANMLLLDTTAVPPNYDPRNGLTAADLLAVYNHNHHVSFLTSPYALIAADVNLSGGVTTYDYVAIRWVFFQIKPNFPAGTWHFVPEYYFTNTNFETGFETLPFTATYAGIPYPLYLDQVTLDMDDNSASNPDSWSFRGIKMGDVNCDMNVDELNQDDEEELVTIGSAIGPCIQTNDVITIDLHALSAQPLLSYQLGIKFDETALQYLGSSSGNLPYYDTENFATKNGELRTFWHSNTLQPVSMENPKTIFKLHFKATDNFCNLSDVFYLDNEVKRSIFYNADLQPMEGGLALSYQKEAPIGRLLSVYPNPTANASTFAFQLDQSCTVEICVSDYLGGILNMSQSYTAGMYAYTFPSLSSLANGPLNFTVKIGNLTYSGILFKSSP